MLVHLLIKCYHSLLLTQCAQIQKCGSRSCVLCSELLSLTSVGGVSMSASIVIHFTADIKDQVCGKSDS